MENSVQNNAEIDCSEQRCSRCDLCFEGDDDRLFCDDCHEAMAHEYNAEPNPRAEEIIQEGVAHA